MTTQHDEPAYDLVGSDTLIIRRVVGVILVNAQGEVLLQQRDDKPDLAYPGYWTLFGGHVEDGEATDDAIRRELREELRIGLPLHFWWSYKCPVRTIPDKLMTINHVYVGYMIHDVATLTLYEGQAMAYFTPTAAAQVTLAFEQSKVLAKFFAEREGLGL
ncbi:MAG: NUDIX domain-containing protein [Armatimonadetes bacterium]|nr:NUDIX domain-containing protein [Anaerolineae bacterium]